MSSSEPCAPSSSTAAPLLHRAVHHEPDVVGERQQPLGEPLEQRERLLDVHALVAPEARELRVRRAPRPAPTSSRSRSGWRRSSTRTPRRATLSSYAGPIPRPVVPIALLAALSRVHQLVIRQHEVRAVADVEPALDVDAVAARARRSRRTACRGRARRRCRSRTARPGCRIPLGIWCSTNDVSPMCDRVPGVRAALVAHDPVGALGEHVDELALPFVAPLRADDDERASLRAEHVGNLVVA